MSGTVIPVPKFTLFNVVFVSRPSIKEVEEGKVPEIVFGPVTVLATDRDAASTKASQIAAASAPPVVIDIDKAEVVVSPFSG